MAVNIDHVLELITRVTNELGRVKDQLLMEKQRAEMPSTELLTREQWAASMPQPSQIETKSVQSTTAAPKASSKS